MTPKTAMKLALLLATTLAAPAQATNEPARLDFSAFKLINDRNIFNPNRSARSAGRTETRREPRPTARTESFALVGIMEYEKGRFAFFDSTSPQYKKVSQAAETIAGYKIVSIAPNSVKLRSGTNELELPVGMQLSRAEQGEWQLGAASAESSTGGEGRSRPAPVVAPTAPTETAPTGGESPFPFPLPTNGEMPLPPEGFPVPVPSAETESAHTNTESPAASGGGESDVLRRLMQRREQELNR
jgi:hypothetical protein